MQQKNRTSWTNSFAVTKKTDFSNCLYDDTYLQMVLYTCVCLYIILEVYIFRQKKWRWYIVTEKRISHKRTTTATLLHHIHAVTMFMHFNDHDLKTQTSAGDIIYNKRLQNRGWASILRTIENRITGHRKLRKGYTHYTHC